MARPCRGLVPSYAYGHAYGYASGYAYGYAHGFAYGHAFGYASGYAYGYAHGYAYGYAHGYAYGYAYGYALRAAVRFRGPGFRSPRRNLRVGRGASPTATCVRAALAVTCLGRTQRCPWASGAHWARRSSSQSSRAWAGQGILQEVRLAAPCPQGGLCLAV